MAKKRSESVTPARVITPIIITAPLAFAWPTTLEGLIDLVNSIPPERKLPPFKHLVGKGLDLSQMANQEYDPTFALSHFELTLHSVNPQYLTNYKNAIKGLPSHLRAPAQYERFRRVRILLHDLAQEAQWPEEYRQSIDVYRTREDEDGAFFLFSEADQQESRKQFSIGKWLEDLEPDEMLMDWRKVPARFEINERTRSIGLSAADHSLFAVLLGADAGKLRECPKCFRLFLLTRKNSTACGKRCAATVRKRKERAAIKNAEEEQKKKLAEEMGTTFAKGGSKPQK